MLPFSVTDGDKDAAAGSLTITVNDDTPTAGTGVRAEHLVNGNFQDTAATNWAYGGNYGLVATVVKGWDISSAGGPNGAAGSQIRLERPNSGFNGIITPDGRPYVDLEATPGDIVLSQDVQGLNAGQSYILQFDLAAHEVSSTGLEVLWNGKMVGVFAGAQLMKTLSLQLTAEAGTNTVSFRETGSKDREGSYLHDIHLYEDPRVGAGLEQALGGEEPGNLVISIAGVPLAAGADGWRGGQFAKAVDFLDAPAVKVLDANGGVHDVTWSGTVDASVAGKATLVGQALIGGVMTTVLTVSVLENGSLEYVQAAPLFHPPGGASDGSLPLVFHYEVTDFDGDSTGAQTATFIITDDAPIAAKDAASVHIGGDIGETITGNVLANDHPGVDGGFVQFIKVDGKVYTYNESTHQITGGGLSLNGDTLSLKTALGRASSPFIWRVRWGPFGDYSYVSPLSPGAAGKSELISYGLLDHDGDHSSASLSIGLTAQPLQSAALDILEKSLDMHASSGALLAALAPAAGDDIVLGDLVFSGSVAGGPANDVLLDLTG